MLHIRVSLVVVVLFNHSVVSASLCSPMNCSMPDFPVLHYLSEFVQTHAHWVSDAIQPSYSLSSPSPPALSLFWHQGLFQWVSSSQLVAKILELQLQHQSFQWIFRVDFPYDWLVGSPCCPRDCQESSPTPKFKASILWHSAFFLVQLSHPYMTTGKSIALTRWTFVGKVISLLFNTLSGFFLLFFQGASVFQFHGYSYHPHWFWSPLK